MNEKEIQNNKRILVSHPSKGGDPECDQCNLEQDARTGDSEGMENEEWYSAKPREIIVTNSETMVVSATGGKKGQKGVRLHAIPWEALAEVGKVYAFGESKYDDYNFRKGYKWSLSFDALQRHLWSFWNGENNDAESKYSHLAHAAWHCLTLLFYSLTGRGEDDRPGD